MWITIALGRARLRRSVEVLGPANFGGAFALTSFGSLLGCLSTRVERPLTNPSLFRSLNHRKRLYTLLEKG